MATLTVRNVDEATKLGLRLRAVRRGVSMEEEIRGILHEAARAETTPRQTNEDGENLYEAIRRLVEPFDGFELEIPPRQPMPEPPTLE